MHELSIAQSLIEMIQPFAPKRITSIRLRVGALTAVLPDSLQFSFEALRPGTAAEHASLVIEEVPVRCMCKSCNSEFEADRLFLACPKCAGCSVEVLSGNELDIVEVELEE